MTIPDITNVAIETSLNHKINEVEGEISSITNVGTASALAFAENKIHSVSNLVKKTDYNTKINETEKKITDHNDDKCIATPDFSKVTAKMFDLRLKQANLARKSDIANFVNKTDFDNKLKDATSNKNKLNGLSGKVKAISTIELTKDLIDKFSIFNEAKNFL